MRLSDNVLVERMTDGRVAIMDFASSEEIVISEEIAAKLVPAIEFFFPQLFIDIDPPKEFPA